VDQCVGEGPCNATKCCKIRNEVKKVPPPSFKFFSGALSTFEVIVFFDKLSRGRLFKAC
jgi:hypothetical protein